MNSKREKLVSCLFLHFTLTSLHLHDTYCALEDEMSKRYKKTYWVAALVRTKIRNLEREGKKENLLEVFVGESTSSK